MRRLLLPFLFIFSGCSVLLDKPIIMNKPFYTTVAMCDSLDSLNARKK